MSRSDISRGFESPRHRPLLVTRLFTLRSGLFGELFQRLQYAWKVARHRESDFGRVRARYFGAVGHLCVSGAEQGNFMMDQNTSAVDHRFVGKDSFSRTSTSVLVNGSCPGGFIENVVPSAKSAEYLNGLDASVPPFPAFHIRKQAPDLCGRSTCFDAFFMRPHGLPCCSRSSRPAGHASRPVERDGTDHKRDASVNGPFGLPRHEAAGQDIDTLKEPDGSDKHEQDADDGQGNSHGLLLD
jgi:hypothetical protein